jgi:anti-sigma regulatory factor (Ser/Thr protein kinase)
MRILKAIKVPAKLEHLHTCVNLVSSCAQHMGFDKKSIHRIELATEEVLVNIFTYAYQGDAGDVEISCMLDHGDTFRIEILDSGVPFNILNVREPNISSDIDNANIGGLGVFMIKTCMDDVVYRRESGKNILTLIAYRNT